MYNNSVKLIETKILPILDELKALILNPSSLEKEISIFLCGGAAKEESQLRQEIGKNIEATQSKYNYPVYFPETLFIEFILGHGNHDLLTLENLLAESVTTVAILVQSPGTIALNG